jgi:hypothetical protein
MPFDLHGFPKMRRRFAFEIRAFTHRRTPKDVDGRRYDVPCRVIGVPKAAPSQLVVEFDDGARDWRHRANVTAIPPSDHSSSPEITKALEDTSMGFWWTNANGTLERPATTYELARALFGDAPARPGWSLVDGVTVIAELRSAGICERAPSEVEREDRETRAAALRVRREVRRDHAAAAMKKYERRIARDTKIVAKWARVLKRAEIALKEDE